MYISHLAYTKFNFISYNTSHANASAARARLPISNKYDWFVEQEYRFVNNSFNFYWNSVATAFNALKLESWSITNSRTHSHRQASSSQITAILLPQSNGAVPNSISLPLSWVRMQKKIKMRICLFFVLGEKNAFNIGHHVDKYLIRLSPNDISEENCFNLSNRQHKPNKSNLNGMCNHLTLSK